MKYLITLLFLVSNIVFLSNGYGRFNDNSYLLELEQNGKTLDKEDIVMLLRTSVLRVQAKFKERGASDDFLREFSRHMNLKISRYSAAKNHQQVYSLILADMNDANRLADDSFEFYVYSNRPSKDSISYKICGPELSNCVSMGTFATEEVNFYPNLKRLGAIGLTGVELFAGGWIMAASGVLGTAVRGAPAGSADDLVAAVLGAAIPAEAALIGYETVNTATNGGLDFLNVFRQFSNADIDSVIDQTNVSDRLYKDSLLYVLKNVEERAEFMRRFKDLTKP